MTLERYPILVSDNNVNEQNDWHSRIQSAPAYQIWEYPSQLPVTSNPIVGAPQSEARLNIFAPNTVRTVCEPDGVKTERSATTSFDSSAVNRMSHEIYVLSQGLWNGYGQGARQAWADPAGTALRLGGSVVGAIAMAKLAGMSRLIGQSCMIGGGIAAASDLAFDGSNRAKINSLGSALSNAWRPDANLNADVDKVSGSLGRVCFDTTMLSLAAAIGARSVYAVETAPGTPVPSGVKGALRATYGNNEAIFVRKNDTAELKLSGNSIHAWSGHDVPTPITTVTTDGVKVANLGKDVRVTEKPNQYLIVEHPKGRTELHFQSGMKVNEAKVNGQYTERTIDYANGLKIRQFADGRLHFNLNGVDQYAIDKDGKIFDPGASGNVWQPTSQRARALPPRPEISQDNGNHVLTFANGTRLHTMPSGMKLISDGSLREML